MKNKGKEAIIEKIVCDQGCGGSYCGLCGKSFGNNPFKEPELGTACPGCGATLVEYSEPFIMPGGSDY